MATIPSASSRAYRMLKALFQQTKKEKPTNLNSGHNKRIAMHKPTQNPILSPIGHHDWESVQTFNAAAAYHNGHVHFFYRALGSDYISRIGYAKSTDGITISHRLNYPIYSIVSHDDFDESIPTYESVKYRSGGGWAGCEDPRITIIDNRIYMLYVAFDGHNMPRVAITSLSLDDLDQEQWDWDTAQIISPPGVVDKSGVLFPEKIQGKYVIMHRIFPDILIDYIDTLDFPKGAYLKGEHRIQIREGHWDSRKIGAGAPPIKTPHGWLLIYYGVDDQNASAYKMGAMLLDLHDPAKVLFRTNNPIIEPEHWYENEGHKAGIVYPCGAVVKDNELYIYYGGADTVVCVAHANLETFLQQLMHKKQPVLHRVVRSIADAFVRTSKRKIPFLPV